MRFITLLSTDFDRSVKLFHPNDARENLDAIHLVSRCLADQANPHEWDSSVTWDMSIWNGYHLQLFMYGLKFAERLKDDTLIQFFEDFLDAYSIDEAQPMERPMWTFHASIVDAHWSYLKSVTQFPDWYMATQPLWFSSLTPQALPVPLSSPLSRA